MAIARPVPGYAGGSRAGLFSGRNARRAEQASPTATLVAFPVASSPGEVSISRKGRQDSQSRGRGCSGLYRFLFFQRAANCPKKTISRNQSRGTGGSATATATDCSGPWPWPWPWPVPPCPDVWVLSGGPRSSRTRDDLAFHRHGITFRGDEAVLRLDDPVLRRHVALCGPRGSRPPRRRSRVHPKTGRPPPARPRPGCKTRAPRRGATSSPRQVELVLRRPVIVLPQRRLVLRRHVNVYPAGRPRSRGGRPDLRPSRSTRRCGPLLTTVPITTLRSPSDNCGG